MARVVAGAMIKLFVNGRLYKEVQELSYDIEYGEEEIFGIDSPFPQEIATNKVVVQGNISGIKIKLSGGLHGYDLRPEIVNVLSSPYVSIRIQDRHSREDLLYVPNAKIVSHQVGAAIKGVMRVSFKFKGLIPYETLDK